MGRNIPPREALLPTSPCIPAHGDAEPPRAPHWTSRCAAPGATWREVPGRVKRLAGRQKRKKTEASPERSCERPSRPVHPYPERRVRQDRQRDKALPGNRARAVAARRGGGAGSIVGGRRDRWLSDARGDLFDQRGLQGHRDRKPGAPRAVARASRGTGIEGSHRDDPALPRSMRKPTTRSWSGLPRTSTTTSASTVSAPIQLRTCSKSAWRRRGTWPLAPAT